MKKQITLLIAVSIAIFTTFESFSQVTSNGDDILTPGTLRYEIANANPNDVITFLPSVSTITLINGELPINANQNLTISATLANPVTLDAASNGRIFNVTAGTLTLDYLTITNGLAYDGGGIYLTNADLTINNCVITNNVANGTGTPAGSGGGIFNDVGGVLIVNDSEISSNTANRAGGGIEDNSGATDPVTLNNVILSDNNAGVAPAMAAPGNGGGLHVSGPGDVIYNGGSVTNNIAMEGGGLWNGLGEMTTTGVTFTGNVAYSDVTGGGALFNNGGTLSVDNTSSITENMASGAATGGRGGAIFNNTDGTLTLTPGLNISGNYASRAGGAIEDSSNGMLILTGIVLFGNSAGIDIELDNFVTANPGNGGALHLSGTTDATITGSNIYGNFAASEGGALWNNVGNMTIFAGSIDNNEAYGDAADNGGGGVFNNGGNLLIQGAAEITNNYALGTSGSGGGVFSSAGNVTIINNTVISGNSATRAGGGIEIVEGEVIITNSFLNGNDANSVRSIPNPGNGGGLHISGAANSTITGGTINSNVAAREGGGLWNSVGVMTLDGVTIDSNTALGAEANRGGAGVFNNGGTLNVTNGTVVSNNQSTGASGSGGGLLSTTGAVTVSNSTFDSNSANRAGGAIELIDGTLDFSNSVMSNNDVNGGAGIANPGNGGGFHVTGMSGTINFTTSSIFGNEAANDGGGLWNQNGTTMNVMNSVLYNNSAGEGGAIYNNTGSITTVMTSTISGNTASVSGGGLTNNGASLSLNAVTVALNTAATGGGIDALNSVSLKNTIVALNTAGSGGDVSGTIVSNDYNLIGSDDLNVFTPQANDLESVDPLVGPLQDNGGTTLTHQLLDGSPAFDAGAPGDNFDDQIGQPVFGASRDIGAYESQIPLSIDEFNEVSVVKIYPNPTKGQFNISIGDNFAGAIEVQIVSITGKLVQKLNIGNGVNDMDISGLSSGMYIVNINTEKGSTSHKLILD